MTDRPLWSVEAMLAAMRATPAGPLPPAVPGLSIDTRTIAPGEAFLAIQGDNRDGHDFVEAALEARAGLAVVAADKRARFPEHAPLIVVADVLAGLRDLARAARGRRRPVQVRRTRATTLSVLWRVSDVNVCSCRGRTRNSQQIPSDRRPPSGTLFALRLSHTPMPA